MSLLSEKFFAYCNSCAWEGELKTAELQKDEFVKCPKCGENVRSGKRPEMFILDGFPPPPNHRSDPFCECVACMAMVSRKIATDKLGRYANHWANTPKKDKEHDN
jgi:predicted RNA-binding Zn-ribbon protein involved in translation (DUF1610 family)